MHRASDGETVFVEYANVPPHHWQTYFVINGRTGEVALRGYEGQPDPEEESLEAVPGAHRWELIKAVASIAFSIATLVLVVLAFLEEC